MSWFHAHRRSPQRGPRPASSWLTFLLVCWFIALLVGWLAMTGRAVAQIGAGNPTVVPTVGNPTAGNLGVGNLGVGNPIDGYPVKLDETVLFRVQQGIPDVMSAQERAQIITARVMQIATDDTIAPTAIRVVEQPQASLVVAGDTVLFTLSDRDRYGTQSRQDTAAASAQRLQTAIQQYRQDRSPQQTISGISAAIGSTLALGLLLLLQQRGMSYLLIRLKAARRRDALDVRVQGFQVLGSNATSYLLASLLKLGQLALILSSLYLYMPFVLSLFPSTRPLGKSIFNDIAERLTQLATTFASYLPNLATIAIIAGCAHYTTQFAKLVILELGRDDAYPWFYPEWVRPTQRLVAILITAIAGVVSVPYLPGFNSPAFQGISLFVGALFTLGSSSAIANTVAGIILVYTRAFRQGDVIRIGDTLGEVIEKSLLVTRLLTFKQEVITLPNSVVLNSNVINFNAGSRELTRHLLLHTTITLGYEVPWRKVHEVLQQAASATPGLLAEPKPFVLQTGLNDFNVSYELNAYSDCPHLMPSLYSQLHQNIQDYCNAAGMEILSPTYTALRDGNPTTLPSDDLPADYSAPVFMGQTRDRPEA